MKQSQVQKKITQNRCNKSEIRDGEQESAGGYWEGESRATFVGCRESWEVEFVSCGCEFVTGGCRC